MKKLMIPFLIIFVVFTFMYQGEVRAEDTTFNVNTVEDFETAISTIQSGSNGTYRIVLGADIEITDSTTLPGSDRKNANTIGNGNTVTIEGNGHKIINSTFDSGRLIVEGGTLNLGLASGEDSLYLSGPGKNGGTSESVLYVGNGTINMYSGVTISNENVTSGSVAGGAVNIKTNGTFNMYGGVMKNNSSPSSMAGGGAILMNYDNGTFNMYGGEIKDNYSSLWGGAISVYSNTSKVNIKGGTISGNKSALGGAISTIGGDVVIEDAVLKDNQAVATETLPYGYGGAVLNYGAANVTMKRNTIKNNSAVLGGAIMSWGDTISLSDNVIKENTAEQGGAIYNIANVTSAGDEITLNTATDKAGGVYADDGEVSFTTSKVYNNKADVAGSDFVIEDDMTSVSIMDASVMGKTATIGGETVTITGWHKDEENKRYSLTNYTDEVLASNVSAGNAYYLIAATNHVKLSFDNDGITSTANVKKGLAKGSKIRINYNNGTDTYDEIDLTDNYTLDNPTRTEYKFVGWSEETVTGYDLGLKANWEKIKKYTVTFDSNDGSGIMDPQEFTYDEEQELTPNTFTKTDCTFNSWNTKADGTGTDYEDQESVKNLTDVDGGTVTLYAQWNADDEEVYTGEDQDEGEDEDENAGEIEDVDDGEDENEEDEDVDDGEEENESESKNESDSQGEKSDLSQTGNKDSNEITNKAETQEQTETNNTEEKNEGISKVLNPKTLDDIMKWVIIFMATLVSYSYLARKTRRIRRPKGKRYR